MQSNKDAQEHELWSLRVSGRILAEADTPQYIYTGYDLCRISFLNITVQTIIPPDHSHRLRLPQNSFKFHSGTNFHPPNVFATFVHYANILHVQKKERRRSDVDLFGTFWATFSLGKWLNSVYFNIHWVFLHHFFAMIFLDIKTPNHSKWLNLAQWAVGCGDSVVKK